MNNVEAYLPPAISSNPSEEPGEIFGSNVFSKAQMQLRLPKSVYKSVIATIEKGAKLAPSVADFVAAAMKDWAREKGATQAFAEAEHARDALLPAMEAVRTSTGALEAVVADDLWPLPTIEKGAKLTSCSSPRRPVREDRLVRNLRASRLGRKSLGMMRLPAPPPDMLSTGRNCRRQSQLAAPGWHLLSGSPRRRPQSVRLHPGCG